jgi:hypothetical protein
MLAARCNGSGKHALASLAFTFFFSTAIKLRASTSLAIHVNLDLFNPVEKEGQDWQGQEPVW